MGKNKLKKWLDNRLINQVEFAKMIGRSKSYVCKILKGERKPSLKTAQVIEVKTKQEVKTTDW